MGMAELLLYASVTILQNLIPVTIHRLIWSFASQKEPANRYWNEVRVNSNVPVCLVEDVSRYIVRKNI